MDKNQMDKYQKLGRRVAYFRREHEFTQWQVCEMLNIDSTYLSKIELGKVGVSLDIIFNLSDILQIPVNRFFEFED